MTQYQVDSDAVATATGAVRGSIGRLTAECSGMYNQLTALQSSWTGGASAAFQTVVTDWKTTQQRVEEALTTINNALNIAGQQYADTEAANARMFGR
jgi:early secretory antigenic target protein ESAT-6